MAPRESWPGCLVEGGKVTCWDIEDPVDISKDLAWEVRDQIKAKAPELARETGKPAIRKREFALERHHAYPVRY